jgi:hypothetical protein
VGWSLDGVAATTREGMLRHLACPARPMADMAKENRIKSFVYDRLSFLNYDLYRPLLDTEWLLSTLFDASLLSTSKPPETAALFLGDFSTLPETIKYLAAGLCASAA